MSAQNTRTLSRSGLIFRIVLMALCVLLVVSVYLTDDLYASYKTSSKGSDSARVAKFQASVGGVETLALDIDLISPGETIQREFTINYDGETAVRYELSVADFGGLPLTYTVEKKDVANTTQSVTAGANAGVFGSVVTLDTMEPGTYETTYVFSITYPAEAADIDDASRVDRVELSIRTVQVD